MKFKNEVVLVTGSTRGIGRGIAEAFAKEGAVVVINGTHMEHVAKTVDEFSTQGYRVYGEAFDVANYDDTFAAIQNINKKLGNVTILVNKAGISPKKDGRKVMFQDMDPEVWETSR